MKDNGRLMLLCPTGGFDYHGVGYHGFHYTARYSSRDNVLISKAI